MKRPNLKKALVLFSVYVVLTLSLAQMTLAAAYCKELEIAPGPSEGDILIEYCTHPLELADTGKWGYFVYAYLPEGTEVTLDIDEGPQMELENMQTPQAASHTPGSDTITLFEPGAFLLLTGQSDELELSSEDPEVFISGTQECGVLVEHNYIVETMLQLEAEQASSPVGMQLDIAAELLGLTSVYMAATMGGVPGGGGASCDLGGAGSGGDGNGGGGVCITGGVEGEYPSFEIVEFLGEEQVNEVTVERKYRIRPKTGPLIGQEFIFVSEKTSYPEPEPRASFNDALYKPDWTKIASKQYSYGIKPRQGLMEITMLEHAAFGEFQGKGLARIFNEYAIARMLEAGMTSIETTRMMAGDANPFTAKTFKNMGFGPRLDITDMLYDAESFEIEIKDSPYLDSRGRPYKYADITAKIGPSTDYFYLFLEDAEGRFLEGPEGEAVYRNNLLGRATQYIRTFLLGEEAAGRTLWGKVEWEAKDMGFLRTSILDQIKWVGGVCEGRLGYYPASAMDPSVFKETNAKTAVYVDPHSSLSYPDGIKTWLASIAAEYGMNIPESSINVEPKGSGKFEIAFKYKGETRTIIFYNRDAGTFLPSELAEYDIYYERWFSKYYADMKPEARADIITNLKKDGIYMVMERGTPPGPKNEPIPRLLGLEFSKEIRAYDRFTKGEETFYVYKKVGEVPRDLLVRIFEGKIDLQAHEALRARTGRAAPTVEGNVNRFGEALARVDEGMRDIPTQHHEFMIDAWDKDVIKAVGVDDVDPRFSAAQKQSLLEQTDAKFAEFARRLGFYGMFGSGGCYKLSKSLTSKDAYLMENTAGEQHNLLEILNEALKKSKERGSIAMHGSTQYLYESPERINWLHIGDVDLIVIDGNKYTVANHIIVELQSRGFIPRGSVSDFTVDVLEGGKITEVRFELIHGETKGGIFDPSVSRAHDYRHYVEGMTFTGPPEEIDDIRSRIEGQTAERRAEVRKVRIERIIGDAKMFASEGMYEKASKRLIELRWFIDLYPERNTMYAEYDAIAKGTRDFRPFYERWGIPEDLEPRRLQRIIESNLARIEYARRINDHVARLGRAINALDLESASMLVVEAGRLRAEIGASTVLGDMDKAFLMELANNLVEMTHTARTALEAAPNVDALEDDAVKEKVGEAKKEGHELSREMTEDASKLVEDVTAEAEAAKEEYDALPEEEKVKWRDRIREKRKALAVALERFVDFSRELVVRVDQSKYVQRVYQARRWGGEKLNQIGLTRFEQRMRAHGMLITGAAILQILAEDAGPKLVVIGGNTDNPFFIVLGRVLEVIAKILHIGFIALIAIAVLVAIFVTGGLATLLLQLALIVILFIIAGYIIQAALKLLWCNYLNRTFMGDPLCTFFYGSAPIIMEAEIQLASGTCTMSVLWRGHTEMKCT